MEYLDILINYIGHSPYIVVLASFSLLLFLFPIPEEAILFTGGYLASEYGGGFVWIPTLAAGILGVFITDYWFFFLSKRFGNNLLKNKYLLKIFSKSRQEKAVNFVERYGIRAVFIVRFIPGGLRNPVFIICGLTNIKHPSFILASLSGAILSSQISFWLGYYLAYQLPPIQILLESVSRKIYISLIIVIIAASAFFIVKKIFSARKKIQP